MDELRFVPPEDEDFPVFKFKFFNTTEVVVGDVIVNDNVAVVATVGTEFGSFCSFMVTGLSSQEVEGEGRVEEEEEGGETLSLSSQMLLVMFAVNLMLNLNLL